MSKGGRYARNNKTAKASGGEKKKGGVLTAVLVVLVLIMAVLIAVLVYKVAMEKLTVEPPVIETEPVAVETTVPVETTVEVTTEPTEVVTETTVPPYTASGKEIINILIVGQSYREGEESYLSDTLILATVNKTTKTLTLTSFLRDAYVDMADYKTDTMYKPCGWNRINVPYNLGMKWGGLAGAMKMISDTIQLNFGVEVDHVVEVNFEGFMNMINTLGGVELELTQSEAKYMNQDLNRALGYPAYDFEEGKETLDGMSALLYARTRKADGNADNDYKRTERQRKLISAVLERLRYRSFGTLKKFAEAFLQEVATDMTDEEILTCIWELLPLVMDLKIESGYCPIDAGDLPMVVNKGTDQERTDHLLSFDAKKNRDMMMAIAEADTLAAAAAAAEATATTGAE